MVRVDHEHRPSSGGVELVAMDEMSSTGPSTMARIEAPVTRKAYMMCAFAAFAGMLFGYDSGYISSVLAMKEFKIEYGQSVPTSVDPSGYAYPTWQKSLIVSILSAGTFFGSLISGWLADRIGRRRTIIGPGCGFFVVGVLVQVAATHVAALVAGRFVAGLGVGFVSAITILYMSEVAPRKVRGALVSCYQFAITIGLMLASCVTYATSNYDNSAAFRVPIAIQFVWVSILALGLFLLPESPRYWVKRNRLDKAAYALARVRGQTFDAECIEDELAEIVANNEYEAHVGEVTWFGCFTGGWRNPSSNLRKVFLGCALQMFQQWTGVNFIFYYNTTFFQQVGISNAFLISMITTVINVASTPISFFAIEKFGRRPLLIGGAIGMTLCEFTIAIVGTSASTASFAANVVLIVFVCLYVFFFAATWGPAAWVVIGEIFHLPMRSKGVALSTASNWLWNTVIAVIVPYLVDSDKGNLGVQVFFVWGATCAVCAVFAWVFVPETRGLTLEQVDQMMAAVPPHKSAAWRPRDTFAHDFGVADGSGGGNSRPVTMESKEPTIESFIDR